MVVSFLGREGSEGPTGQTTQPENFSPPLRVWPAEGALLLGSTAAATARTSHALTDRPADAAAASTLRDFRESGAGG